MNCEMCGKSVELLFKTVIEGTELSVCKNCSSHGKVIRPLKKTIFVTKQASKPKTEKELVEVVVSDFAQKIRTAREKLGLSQEDFAKKLHEKESIISKMESGQFTPTIDTAKKLEKILHIKLVELCEDETEKTKENKEKSDCLTIGDIIKFH